MLQKIYSSTAIIMLLGNVLFAQSPVSGFMTPKGKTTLSFSYTKEKNDGVFLVPTEIKSVPVFNELERTSYSLYGTYGVSDKLNLIVSLPYIQSKGKASEQVLENLQYENKRSGLQDISVYGKYKIYEKVAGNNTFNILGALGVQIPLGNYKVDEGLQSILAIGNRATQLNGLAIGFVKNASGAFASAQAGYSLRSKVVPDAVISEVKLGYAGKFFYVDGYLASQLSTSGVDILGAGFVGDFTATRVSYTRVGGTVYVPIGKFTGISLGLSQFVKGRNINDASGVSVGISGSF